MTEPTCRVCGLRTRLSDPADPESWVHDEDQEFADHTAEVYYVPPAPEVLADLERQVNDAHARYSLAVADIARAQLLLLCHEVRELAPNAAVLIFEPSDQGNFLDLADVHDAQGQVIIPTDANNDPTWSWDENVRSWDLDTDKPASRDVWEPLAFTVSNGMRHAVDIDAALEALRLGLGRTLPEAIVMVDDDGEIIALACPNRECPTPTDVRELDLAERWNQIEIEDGGLQVIQDDSDFQTESFVCGACGTHLDAPVEAYDALTYG